MEHFNNKKYEKAKQRVEEFKGFYIHLVVYIAINTFILVNIYLHADTFWEWPHFVPMAGWGVGLFFHGAKVFGFNPIFGKDWEERQIRKFMERDKQEMDKYK